MAQSANGFQTGLSVFPSQVAVFATSNRNWGFNALGGLLGNAGITWSVGAGAKGSINAAGLYSAPATVTSASVDQVLATALDGSQAQALVYLAP